MRSEAGAWWQFVSICFKCPNMLFDDCREARLRQWRAGVQSALLSLTQSSKYGFQKKYRTAEILHYTTENKLWVMTFFTNSSIRHWVFDLRSKKGLLFAYRDQRSLVKQLLEFQFLNPKTTKGTTAVRIKQCARRARSISNEPRSKCWHSTLISGCLYSHAMKRV